MPVPEYTTPQTESHTPGPWEWHEVERPDVGMIDAVSLNGPAGYVLYGVWHNDSTAGVGITSEANARLIAAAPELLEALELLLERFTDGRREADAASLATWADEVRAVIAAATGGAA